MASPRSSHGRGGRRSSVVELEAFNVIRIALNIAAGMRYLHSHGMVHCDLK